MKKVLIVAFVIGCLGCGGESEVKNTDPKLAPGTEIDPRIKMINAKESTPESGPRNDK